MLKVFDITYVLPNRILFAKEFEDTPNTVWGETMLGFEHMQFGAEDAVSDLQYIFIISIWFSFGLRKSHLVVFLHHI